MVSKAATNVAYEVAGAVLPKPVAGHPALELCNTFAGWGEPADEGREYLNSYRDLAIWAREQGLISASAAARLADAARPPGAGRAGPREAPALGPLRRPDRVPQTCRVGRGQGRGRGAAAAASMLEHRPGGARWALPESRELPVQAAALAAAELLVAAPRIGRCPGHHCGWLFLNPRGTRRWCTMAVCGNRAKAARYAAR